MHIFEKLPQILGLCPIVKIRSTLEKSDPPKHFVDPPKNPKNPKNPKYRKILHKLLDRKSIERYVDYFSNLKPNLAIVIYYCQM